MEKGQGSVHETATPMASNSTPATSHPNDLPTHSQPTFSRPQNTARHSPLTQPPRTHLDQREPISRAQRLVQCLEVRIARAWLRSVGDHGADLSD
eukprot:353939-Chlamydomonas_euryale.AAC.34